MALLSSKAPTFRDIDRDREIPLLLSDKILPNLIFCLILRDSIMARNSSGGKTADPPSVVGKIPHGGSKHRRDDGGE